MTHRLSTHTSCSFQGNWKMCVCSKQPFKFVCFCLFASRLNFLTNLTGRSLVHNTLGRVIIHVHNNLISLLKMVYLCFFCLDREEFRKGNEEERNGRNNTDTNERSREMNTRSFAQQPKKKKQISSRHLLD